MKGVIRAGVESAYGFSQSVLGHLNFAKPIHERHQEQRVKESEEKRIKIITALGDLMLEAYQQDASIKWREVKSILGRYWHETGSRSLEGLWDPHKTKVITAVIADAPTPETSEIVIPAPRSDPDSSANIIDLTSLEAPVEPISQD